MVGHLALVFRFVTKGLRESIRSPFFVMWDNRIGCIFVTEG